jgi:hypothetical protein
LWNASPFGYTEEKLANTPSCSLRVNGTAEWTNEKVDRASPITWATILLVRAGWVCALYVRIIVGLVALKAVVVRRSVSRSGRRTAFVAKRRSGVPGAGRWIVAIRGPTVARGAGGR